MPEEKNEVMTNDVVTETNEDTADECGSPVGLIIAAGSILVGGIYFIGRKIFGRKKYAEVVNHGLFGKTDNK